MVSARPRVLQVINSLHGGGAEHQFVEMVNRLDRARFEVAVCVFTPGGSNAAALQQSALARFVCLEKRAGRDLLRLACRLRGLLQSYTPDIVHTWLPYSNLVCALSGWGLPLAHIASIRGNPERFETPSRLGGVLERLTTGWALRRSRGVVVNSQRARQALMRRGLARVHYVPNGIDLDAAQPAEEAPSPAATRRIVAVGRLSREKGYPHLLEAVAQVRDLCPPVELVIAGEGPDREALEVSARRLGVAERVRFAGHVDSIYPLLRGAEAFVLPSLHEGMPNALMEAMAAGRPLVATAVDGVLDLVTDGEEALLVPPGDGAALARALRTILTDPALADRLGRRARERIAAFDFSVSLRAMEAVYDGVLTPKAGDGHGR